MKPIHLAAFLATLSLLTASAFSQTETPPTTPENPNRRRVLTVPMENPTIRTAPPAAGEKPQPTTYETRQLVVNNLDIRLNAVSGNIVFTAGDIEYVYYPRTGDHSTPAADVAACLALLPELFKVASFEVKVPIRLPELPADRKRITVSELTLTINKIR